MGVAQRTSSTFWMLCFIMVLSITEQTSFSDDLFHQQMDVDWPSCSELRAMWLNLRNLVSHSEITNEIPIIPSAQLERVFHSRHTSGHRRKPNKAVGNHVLLIPKINEIPVDQANYRMTTTNIGKTQDLGLPFTPNHIGGTIPTPEEPFAAFGDILFPEPVNQPAMSVNILSDPVQVGPPPSGEMVPQWGLDDMGSFGRFSDEDETMARSRGSVRVAKFDDSTWHETLRNPGVKAGPNDDRQASCEVVENRVCSSNDHCACRGWSPSRCIAGRCHTSSLMSGDLMDTSAWHSGPLPFSKFGLVTRTRRSTSSTKLM